jgi:hypothetical protein
MGMKCWAYQALDWLRRSKPGSVIFYKGQRITIKTGVTVTAIVTSLPNGESDGDTTFNVALEPDQAFRHCEVTPCASADVHAIARSLTIGTRVELAGDERYDPHHVFDDGGGGWMEIHPVRTITILSPGV